MLPSDASMVCLEEQRRDKMVHFPLVEEERKICGVVIKGDGWSRIKKLKKHRYCQSCERATNTKEIDEGGSSSSL